MGLSEQLISQFVKATNDDKKTSTESTVYGTTVYYNGRTYVKIDGSELLTPVKSTATVNEGDKVTVVIGNHTATITGNMSDPSASSKTVKEQGSKINEFEIIIADKVSVDELEAEKARIKDLETDNVLIKDQLTAANAEIQKLTAADVTITGRLDANDASIKKIDTEKLSAEIAEATYATIENLEVVDAKVYNLDAVYGDFEVLTTNKFVAIEADITSLETDKLSATDAALMYANIDFSNIGQAAVEKLFTESGIIKNLVMSDGAVTGELVGVTIKGDWIEGNTIIADKLVIKGEDGLYYQMNVDGGATVSDEITEEKLQNGLHGSIIITNTITAEKINVDDLVAFGATIGGFHIVGSSEDKPGAIYSGVKESVDNTTRGTYLDDDGQVAFGNASNFVKFYKDEETGNYYLRVSADQIVFGGTGRDVESDLINISHGVTNNENATHESSAKIEDLKRILQQVVTDEHGQSLMTTVKESYTLTEELIDSTTEGLVVTRLEGKTTTTGEDVYLTSYADGTEYYCAYNGETLYKVTYSPETYTFNISDLEDAIAAINANVTNLSNKTDSIDGTITQMLKTVTDMALMGGYIVIDENMEVTNSDGTKEVVPAIILGASDSDFKVIITNKQIAFCEGNTIPAYISGQTFIAQNIEVKQELRQGGFSWVVHDGNYGLVWRGHDCYITQNLASEITSSNTATVITAAESFTTSLSATNGYLIESVIVTMSGIDISSKVVTNNIFSCDINIPRVKGDINITVTVTENLWDITSRTFADENIDDTTYAKIQYSTANGAIRTPIPMSDTSAIDEITVDDNGDLRVKLAGQEEYSAPYGYPYVELLFDLDENSEYELCVTASDYGSVFPFIHMSLYENGMSDDYGSYTLDQNSETTYKFGVPVCSGYTSIMFSLLTEGGSAYFRNIALYKKVNTEMGESGGVG